MTERQALIERLRGFPLLDGVPPEELDWLAAKGGVRALEAGDVLAPQSAEATEGLFLPLSGVIEMYLTRGGERRKAMEWGPGEVSGLIPYSRMKAPPGDLVAQTPAEVFILHRNLFPEMARECHEVTTRLVHVMVDRARNFTSADLHDEKLAALGRLAAGLAHELNNPASAVVSGARSLVGCFAQAEAASAELALSRLEAGQLATVRRIAAVCAGDVAARRSPIEQAEFEDLIADWLDAHGASDEVAQALAQTAVTEELLDQLGDAVEGESLEVALRWIAAMTQGRSLAIEVEQAASSISDLVRAVQGFTAMDRALVAEPIGIGNGLSTSVRVLGAKARQGSTRVRLELPDDLPRVEAFLGELNQVWLNLISNAIDAAGEGGSVVVAASAEDGWVTVRVVDDGPGISAQDRPFIFEPFFTTKKVGEGTGLGLDIVRRLVLRNEGEIEVDSKPGRTEFRVRLPALPG